MTNTNDYIAWQVPEYEKYERSRKWYVVAAGVAGLMLVYSLFTANFLFALIIIMTAVVIVINDGKEPDKVEIVIADEGIQVGKKIYEYEDFQDFSILYKPNSGLKNLYFEFKNPVKPRISIPLLEQNPLQIREKLLNYLKEDLERDKEPLSEGLGKMLKF